MNELSSARACRYSSLTGPGSEPSRGGAPRVAGDASMLVGGAEPVQRGKHFVGNLGLHRDQIQRRNANGAARAHALRGHIEQLPVQVEAARRSAESCRRAQTRPAAFGPRPADPSARWAAASACSRAAPPAPESAPAARQWRRPARSRRAAPPLSRPDWRRAAPPASSAARARRADSRNRSASMERKPVARFSASAAGGGQVGRRVAGNDAGLDLQRLHDGLQRLAHLGGRGVARGGILFQARRDHALQLRRDSGHDLAQIRRLRETGWREWPGSPRHRGARRDAGRWPARRESRPAPTRPTARWTAR